MGENNVFQKCYRIVFDSPQTMDFSKKTLLQCVGLTKLLCAINKDYWFSKYDLWSTIPKDTDSPKYGLSIQPCHGVFIALDFFKYWLLYCHMKMERVREREKDLEGRENSTKTNERET